MDFTDKKLLHKKVNSKEVYVDFGGTEDIPEDADACTLRQFGDLTELN